MWTISRDQPLRRMRYASEACGRQTNVRDPPRQAVPAGGCQNRFAPRAAMFKAHLWELALGVLAAALLCRAARLDTPLVVVFAFGGLACACASLGAWSARRARRSPLEGIWLGFVLGPIGVAIASSRPIEAGESERRDRTIVADRRNSPPRSRDHSGHW
jgi:hypothetical protein